MTDTPSPTLFQLLTGQTSAGKGFKGWRMRGTSDWLFIYTLAGKGRFGHAAGELVTEPGDAVFLRPHTLHDYGVEASLEHWELLWAHFHPRPHWTAYLQFPEVSPGLLHLHVNKTHRKEIEKRFADVHTLATSGRVRREDFAMNALEEVLLLFDSINPRARQRLDPRMAKAQAYLRQHAGERVTLKQLAKVSHCSVSRLSFLFREQVGMTPLEFLDAERLERAKRLLELTPMSVQDIAREVGFENPFYFTRRFKKFTGMSPRAFRTRRDALLR
jgi:AraC family transcriptional regulator, arabinose operon regulatory protein